jgi:hypothetical protein
MREKGPYVALYSPGGRVTALQVGLGRE